MGAAIAAAATGATAIALTLPGGTTAERPTQAEERFGILRAPADRGPTSPGAQRFVETAENRVAEAARRSGIRRTIHAPSARLARSDGRGQEIYVAAGDDAVCLLARGPAQYIACGDLPDAAGGRRPITTVTPLDDGGRVDVLLPDGVSEITVTGSDGPERVAVRNNVASAVVPGQVQRVAFTAPDGAEVAYAPAGGGAER
jgi:hypothetical protein